MRELFASLLFGWVAQSRENGQINGCLGCRNTGTTEPGLQALFSFFSKSALIILIGTIAAFADTTLIDTTAKSDSLQIDSMPKNELSISDIGGGLYGSRYGESTFPWIKIYLAGSIDNLAGTNQRLTIHGSFARIRHLGVRWEIPFDNNWYLTAGALAGSHPSIQDTWHAQKHVAGRVEIGKKIGKNTISVESVPHYWNYELRDILQHQTFEELTTTLLWKTDLRNRSFNPSKGIYFSQSLTGNPISTYREIGSNRSFYHIGGTTDLRGFISPGNGPIILGAQFKAELLYAGSLNRFDRLFLGGNETVRGFESGAFGIDKIYNNRSTVSAECRFPIFKVKGINLSFLSWYDPSMKRLPFDITGAVFINAGHLWDELEDGLNNSAPHHSGAGAGTGIRVLLPTLGMTVSGDLGWAIHAPESLKTAMPAIHGYLGFPF